MLKSVLTASALALTMGAGISVGAAPASAQGAQELGSPSERIGAGERRSRANRGNRVRRAERNRTASDRAGRRSGKVANRKRGDRRKDNRSKVVIRDRAPRVVVRDRRRPRVVVRDRGPKVIFRERGPRVVIRRPRRIDRYYDRPFHWGPRPRVCTPRRALNKAFDIGIRRARVVRVNRRAVVVRGFRRGLPVKARFARFGRFCPTLNVRVVRNFYR